MRGPLDFEGEPERTRNRSELNKETIMSGAGNPKSSDRGFDDKTPEQGKPTPTPGTSAEQAREAGESQKARNAQGSNRERMVDIGRGNQQAGRHSD